MATPANDTYSAASGVVVHGGRLYRPAWRRAMAINTWATIPASNTLSSIDPTQNPAINAAYPGLPEWAGSQSGIINAWGGAAFDQANSTLWLPLSGGHADYGGNEPYKIDLSVDTPLWKMVRNPSGAIGNLITTKDSQEATGLYSDGRLRAVHSYNNNLYVPGVGPVVARMGGCWYSGQAGANKASKINETTGEATLLVDYPAVSGIGSPYGGTAYDSLRNYIYTLGVNTAQLAYINLSNNTVAKVGIYDNIVSGYCKTVYLAEYDLLAVFQNGGAGFPSAFYLFDPLNSYVIIQPTITGTFPAGYTLSGSAGAEWDAVNHRFVLWGQGSNTAAIATLAPTGNPRTGNWNASTLTLSGANTVTPTASSANGTYGRFGYSAKLGGCFLLNATNQPIYFFATE